MHFPEDFHILPSSDMIITVTSSWYFLRSPFGISNNSHNSIPANREQPSSNVNFLRIIEHLCIMLKMVSESALLIVNREFDQYVNFLLQHATCNMLNMSCNSALRVTADWNWMRNNLTYRFAGIVESM